MYELEKEEEDMSKDLIVRIRANNLAEAFVKCVSKDAAIAFAARITKIHNFNCDNGEIIRLAGD